MQFASDAPPGGAYIDSADVVSGIVGAEPSGGEPAVGNDPLSGDVSVVRDRQEQDDPGDVFWLTESTRGRTTYDLLQTRHAAG